MNDYNELCQKLIKTFAEKLNVEAPTVETDLVNAGLLDSLALVELLLHLEQEYGVQISLDELAIDNFRSISSIAQFLQHQAALEPVEQG
jgi:acyl carrier protein